MAAQRLNPRVETVAMPAAAVVGVIVTRRRGSPSPVESAVVYPDEELDYKTGAQRPRLRRSTVSVPVSATLSTASRIMAADSSAWRFSAL